jgi:hypothetical protein
MWAEQIWKSGSTPEVQKYKKRGRLVYHDYKIQYILYD